MFRIVASGLDLQRRWYLLNKIRKYVSEDKQDIVCLKQTDPLPGGSSAADEPSSGAAIPLVGPEEEGPTTAKRGQATAKGKGRGKKSAQLRID